MLFPEILSLPFLSTVVVRDNLPASLFEFYTPAIICAVADSSLAMVVTTHSLRKDDHSLPLKAQKSLQRRVTKLACAYMKYPDFNMILAIPFCVT
jgi:p-aminobenzoyl-glutamate transporter AbgT